MDGASVDWQGQSSIEALDQETDLLERIQKGDEQAIAAFAKKYRELIVAITDDVFEDSELSTCAAKAAFKQAVYQIRSGVRTGKIEPWLMWIARNEALSLTQLHRNAQMEGTRSDALGTESTVLPLYAKAGQGWDDNHNGASLHKEKQPVDADGIERSQTAQRWDGQTDSYARIRQVEEMAPKDATNMKSAVAADLREEPLSKDPTSTSDAPNMQQLRGRKEKNSVGITIVLTGLILLLAWMALGLGMSRGLIQFHDLGYEWFNANVFPFFQVSF